MRKMTVLIRNADGRLINGRLNEIHFVQRVNKHSSLSKDLRPERADNLF